ncbi:MAG: hypothetical protein U0L87_00115, partial [Bifidobacterium adolescentis]|nr:hypothetical protein [Bifidobacterium adolescentis]
MVQRAYSVRSVVTGLAKSYFDPPFFAVYQPAKVYPSRVGAAGAVTYFPETTETTVLPDPPFVSNATVNDGAPNRT